MKINISMNDYFRTQDVSSGDIISMFICLQKGELYYPSVDWVDNPAIIVGWWAHSAIDLINGGDGQGMCFMEGSYDIDLKYKDEKFYLDSEDGEMSWVLSKKELIQALVEAYEKLIALYKELGVDDPVGFIKSIELLNDAAAN